MPEEMNIYKPTEQEEKEAMKEMECWSVDNHLKICDKHFSTQQAQMREGIKELYLFPIDTEEEEDYIRGWNEALNKLLEQLNNKKEEV